MKTDNPWGNISKIVKAEAELYDAEKFKSSNEKSNIDFDKLKDKQPIIGVDLTTKPDKTVAQITVHDNNIPRTINVEVIGDLGLEFGDSWDIWHLPTGARFSSVVPGFVTTNNNSGHRVESFDYTSEQLLNWMKKVQEGQPTAWIMLRQLTPANFRDNGTAAKEIIKRWCLSVSVKE